MQTPAPPSLPNTTAAYIREIALEQRQYFAQGLTHSIAFRQKQLHRLMELVTQNEAAILEALHKDLGKPTFESYASEVGFMKEEIRYTLKKGKHWAKPQKVHTPLVHWPSKSFIQPEPKGTVLIIAPWNYPFQLLLAPLVAALAAGNTVLLKPSEQAPHTAVLLEKLVQKYFDPQVVGVVQGEGQVVIPLLIAQKPQHVFFTGSTAVGRKIAEMAAPHLIPVTLELGGKSPAIVEASANLKIAARRIAFGKWLNAGQTCVAPDYVLVHKEVQESFLEILKNTLQEFYPENPLHSGDYGHIINEGHYQRIQSYLAQGQVYYGGESDGQSLTIAPTILHPVSQEAPVMQEEIFGPVLPVLAFAERQEAQGIIARNPNPLALYIFAEKAQEQEPYWRSVPFGGGAINNTIIHLSNPALPFGGLGNSGMGNYHGEAGFRTFSHYKSIVKTATWFDLRKKYPPYTKLSLKIIKRFM